MEIEVEIPEAFWEQLLLKAAIREEAVEEIVERAVRGYMEGDG